MTFLGLLVVLVLVGVALHYVGAAPNIDATFKFWIRVIVVIVVLVWVLELFGLMPGLGPLNRPVGRLR